MALTLLYRPDTNTPAYNPCKFGYDSTNTNVEGFRYIFDIYDGATQIAEYRVIPKPTTKYGDIDISKLLSSYVSLDFNPSNTTFISPDNTYFEYTVKVGEEYFVEYAYTSFNDDNGYVRLTGATGHSFVAGDQINITETTYTNALINGLHTVLSVTATTITTDIIYANAYKGFVGGNASFADNRKTIFRDLDTQSGVVFNGVYSWQSFRDYDESQYELVGNTKLFLTDIPNPFTTYDESLMYFNILNDNEAATRYMVFENSDGDILYKDVTNAADVVTIVPVGGGNVGTLTVDTGTLPLVKSTTEYYDIYYTDNAFTELSKRYRINIDRRCRIEEFDILFLDRLGSMIPFSFSLKAQESGKIKRDTYSKDVEGFDNGSDWSYNSYEAGTTTYSVDITKEFKLNTNWMTQEENEYFTQLLSSFYTYINVNSEWLACTVKESSFEVTRQRGKNLIMKTIKVELANNDIVNG